MLCFEIWTAFDISKRQVRTGDGLVKYLDNIADESVHVRVGRKTLKTDSIQCENLIQDISWAKRTAQKDAMKDITSDSQVNSYFTYKLSPASLTFNIYFYLFLHLYITRITINNSTPHQKSPKNQHLFNSFWVTKDGLII